MTFEFATAARIVFGAGKLREVGSIARELGKRALVVTGKSANRAKPLFDALKSQGIETAAFSVAGEPTIEVVKEATRLANEQRCDLVVGFGGGSALDTGKAVAALLTNGGDLLDYMEVIGKGRPFSKPSFQPRPAPARK